MFPADSFHAQYFEEREAAEATKRLAKLQAQHQKAEAVAVAAAVSEQSNSATFTASRPSSSRPPHLTLPQHHPAFVRPSSGLLGNIFQGFVQARANSQSPTMGSPATSGASTPAAYHSPLATPLKVVSQSEMEAMIAEKRRDADICALPGWH